MEQLQSPVMSPVIFLKVGDASPPVVNGQRLSFNALGPGYSYFATSNPSVAKSIRDHLSVGGSPSVREVTRAEFEEQKKRSLSDSSRIAQQRPPSPMDKPYLQPAIVSPPVHTAVADPVVSRPVVREAVAFPSSPIQQSILPPVQDVDKPAESVPPPVAPHVPVAEPAPDDNPFA